ncbi:MAG: hypothetical protein KDB16_12380 [Acidimicrobiales bacterium]|nr:hypothetical protein [Acidimicrobiales bacterium]
MNTLTTYYDFLHMGIEYNLNLAGVGTRDEDGAVSTEMAVVMAAMVAIAVALGVIFIAKARSNANNIPDSVSPPA